MSIVPCEACGKEISDKAALCSHCGFQRREVSAEELAKFQQRRARDAVYRWNMFSYLALMLFVAGFGWYWWASAGYTQEASAGPFYAMVAAAVAYAVVRVFLYLAKRKLALLRRAAP